MRAGKCAKRAALQSQMCATTEATCSIKANKSKRTNYARGHLNFKL